MGRSGYNSKPYLSETPADSSNTDTDAGSDSLPPRKCTRTIVEPLEDYVYFPLADNSLDIRLLELLPAEFCEDITIRIHHVPLVEPEPKRDLRAPLRGLGKYCPKPWSVCRNLEGRALFWRKEDDGTFTTSWRHLNPEFDALQYELPVVEDHHPIKFDALSYAWGSDKRRSFMKVQTKDSLRKLAVTSSLLEALHHWRLCDDTKTSMIWVDAICLNQEDKIEKAHHLSRMRDIYRLAEHVRIWLGPASGSFEFGRNLGTADILHTTFKTLKYIAKQVEVSEDGISLLPAPGATQKDWYQNSYKDELISMESNDTLGLEGLKILLRTPWFSRLWVVQEIQLANKTPGAIFQCGWHTISMSEFHRAIAYLELKTRGRSHNWKADGSTAKDLRRSILNAVRLLHPMAGGNHRVVMGLNWNRKCRDDRDRVYGLLGLTSKEFSEQLLVCYDDHKADVYKDHFLCHLRLSGRLELLLDFQSTHRTLSAAASWIPDWSAKSDCRTRIETQFAAYNTRTHFNHSKHYPDILTVHGVRCAAISSLTKYLTMEKDPGKAVDDVRGWQPPNMDTTTYDPTGQTQSIVFALTILQGDVEDRWSPPVADGDVGMRSVNNSSERAGPSARAPPLALLNRIGPNTWIHPDEGCPSLHEWSRRDRNLFLFTRHFAAVDAAAGDVPIKMSQAHITRALTACYGRRFFQTTEGYMGLAPRDSREGDVIAILLGCLNPVVLRPLREKARSLSGQSYKYVSECFVHGLQDSSGLLGPLPQPWVSFLIRCPGIRMCLGFRNTETGVETLEDPRLEPMGAWERLWDGQTEVQQHHPFDFCYFRHRETGVVVTYDPRLEPDKLKSRGVDLIWFSMV